MFQVSLDGTWSSTRLSLSPCRTACSGLEKHRKHLPEPQPLSPWPFFLTYKLYPPPCHTCVWTLLTTAPHSSARTLLGSMLTNASKSRIPSQGNLLIIH